MRSSIVLFLGPTGVGKSSLAIEVAEKINAEIVSADSVQIYKNVDIGSAKPTLEERARVPHHLVDILELDEPFDVARFLKMADEAIENIQSRGKRVLVVGGTNLYIRGLLHGVFEAPPADPQIRQEHLEFANEMGVPALHAKLKKIDPEAAERIHENDRIRISRALEVFALTGKSISAHHAKHAFAENRYRAQKIAIFRNRDILYSRIDRRVDRMIEEGIIEEYRKLVEHFDKNLKPLNAIGYRHVRMLEEGLSYEEFERLLKRDTRRFAKSQLSWLRGEDAWWYHADELDVGSLSASVERFFAGDEAAPTWNDSPARA